MYNQVESHFVDNDIHSTAIYSPCKSYRYLLNRTTVNAKKSLLFILLNPSTATEFKNDPTIARCQKRSEVLNYKAFTICNLFAFRTKSPRVMKNYFDPVGPENDRLIGESILNADKIICAWGNHGTHLSQAEKVVKIIKAHNSSAFHLGLTKNNQPMHPLYIEYSRKPVKWF